LPKTVEDLVSLPEEPKYYLKDYQQERDEKFKVSYAQTEEAFSTQLLRAQT